MSTSSRSFRAGWLPGVPFWTRPTRSVAGTALLLSLLLGCSNRMATVEMVAAARSPGASWSYLSDTMEESAALVEKYAQDDLERREGYRLLARTLGLGFERFLELGDPAKPDFYRLQSAYRKFAGDNPDQLYHSAPVDGSRTYRIRGHWASDAVTTQLLEVSVYGGGLSFDDDAAKRRLVGHLDESQLHVAEDGSFEVLLSPTRQEGNWIQLDDDAQTVLVRRYFAGPQLADPLPMTIELVGEEPSRKPLDQADLARGLIGTGAFLRETSKIWPQWHADLRERNGANNLRPMEDDGDLLTPAGMTYMEGAWEVEPEQALLIRFVPPEVPYWGFLPMSIWMESFDWRVAPVTLNNFNAKKGRDGSVTIILSERDPGLPNWLATLGHRRGLMSLRLARLGDQSTPEVQVQRVPFEVLQTTGLAALQLDEAH